MGTYAAARSRGPSNKNTSRRLSRTAEEARILVFDDVVTPYQHIVDAPARRLLMQKVVRVGDTITLLFRKKKISQAQKSAAEKYQNAYERQFGSISGTLDPSKVGGGGSNFSPHEWAMTASRTIKDANALLGKRTSRIVEQIVGEGLTVEEFVRKFYGSDLSRIEHYRHRTFVGQTLRDGLEDLAEIWGFNSSSKKGRPIRASHFGEKATAGDVVELKPGVVAHAGRDKVDFSGEK